MGCGKVIAVDRADLTEMILGVGGSIPVTVKEVTNGELYLPYGFYFVYGFVPFVSRHSRLPNCVVFLDYMIEWSR